MAWFGFVFLQFPAFAFQCIACHVVSATIRLVDYSKGLNSCWMDYYEIVYTHLCPHQNHFGNPSTSHPFLFQSDLIGFSFI